MLRFAQYLLLFLTLSFVLLLSNKVFAQAKHLSSSQLINLELKAQDYMQQFKYHLAAQIYERLDSSSQLKGEDLFHLGVCYLNDQHSEKALAVFKKCMASPDEHPKTLHFYYARALHFENEWNEAIKHYSLYAELFPKSKRTQEEIANYIAQCERGKAMEHNSLKKTIKPIQTLNTPFNEYGPVLNAEENELYFTANYPQTTGGKIDEYYGIFYEDIYFSKKDDNGHWSPAIQLGPEINTNGHDAVISLTPDGLEMLIYRYDPGVMGGFGRLYYSKKNNGKWSEALPLNYGSKGSWDPSATLNEEQNTLIFASNMRGGLGGTDLYVSRKSANGEWSSPKNLGAEINTEDEEDSPFLHPDGETLFFSSKGHKGIGGYDIFKAKFNPSTEKWEGVGLAPIPINSGHDDIHYSWTADGTRVYFSNIRSNGKGGKDLYIMDLKQESNHLIEMRGKILDKETGKPILAEIEILENFNQSENQILTHSYRTDNETGKYLLFFIEDREFTINVQAQGYERYSEVLNTKGLKVFKILDKDIQLSKLNNGR